MVIDNGKRWCTAWKCGGFESDDRMFGAGRRAAELAFFLQYPRFIEHPEVPLPARAKILWAPKNPGR